MMICLYSKLFCPQMSIKIKTKWNVCYFLPQQFEYNFHNLSSKLLEFWKKLLNYIKIMLTLTLTLTLNSLKWIPMRGKNLIYLEICNNRIIITLRILTEKIIKNEKLKNNTYTLAVQCDSTQIQWTFNLCSFGGARMFCFFNFLPHYSNQIRSFFCKNSKNDDFFFHKNRKLN